MVNKKGTVQDRANEFARDGFYVSDIKTLMCKFCNACVEWQRKDTVQKLIKSAGHKRNRDRVECGPSSAKPFSRPLGQLGCPRNSVCQLDDELPGSSVVGDRQRFCCMPSCDGNIV